MLPIFLEPCCADHLFKIKQKGRSWWLQSSTDTWLSDTNSSCEIFAVFWLLYIIVLLLVQLKPDRSIKHRQTGILLFRLSSATMYPASLSPLKYWCSQSLQAAFTKWALPAHNSTKQCTGRQLTETLSHKKGQLLSKSAWRPKWSLKNLIQFHCMLIL